MQPVQLTNHPTLKAFLQQEPVATIAVPIDDKGTIHAATLLYWNSEEPLRFYFVTNRDSEKVKLLKTQSELQCACVVGTYKGTPFTLQMHGTLRGVTPDDAIRTAYYAKTDNHYDDIADDKNMCIMFTPTWARFTDYSQGYHRQKLAV